MHWLQQECWCNTSFKAEDPWNLAPHGKDKSSCNVQHGYTRAQPQAAGDNPANATEVPNIPGPPTP